MFSCLLIIPMLQQQVAHFNSISKSKKVLFCNNCLTKAHECGLTRLRQHLDAASPSLSAHTVAHCSYVTPTAAFFGETLSRRWRYPTKLHMIWGSDYKKISEVHTSHRLIITGPWSHDANYAFMSTAKKKKKLKNENNRVREKRFTASHSKTF